MKKSALFLIVFILLTGCQTTNYERPKRLGGPCEYESYPGVAEIVSIKSKSDGDRFEVRFIFRPNKQIENKYVWSEGKTFLLYDNHFEAPSQAFLTKNRIFVGRKLEGTLMAIVKGTCSPIVFTFPELKKAD